MTNARLVADINLGTNKKDAKAQLKEIKKEFPGARFQFSQHAPEGFDGAYSVQVFRDDEPEFDRINHGPFEHPVSPKCVKCHDKGIIYFGDADGNEHSFACDCV